MPKSFWLAKGNCQQITFKRIFCAGGLSGSIFSGDDFGGGLIVDKEIAQGVDGVVVDAVFKELLAYGSM